MAPKKENSSDPTPPKAVHQSLDDLGRHLREQAQFLRNSADAYDRGFEGEARRMATVIRVLVHDTKRSKSLLGQLNLLHIEFYDTASNWNPKNLLGFHGLVQMRLWDGPAEYRAPLDNRSPHILRWTTFQKWWGKIVFVDRQRHSLSRKDLV